MCTHVCVPVCRCVLCVELLVGLTVSEKKERKWKGNRVKYTYLYTKVHSSSTARVKFVFDFGQSKY